MYSIHFYWIFELLHGITLHSYPRRQMRFVRLFCYAVDRRCQSDQTLSRVLLCRLMTDIYFYYRFSILTDLKLFSVDPSLFPNRNLFFYQSIDRNEALLQTNDRFPTKQTCLLELSIFKIFHL